MQFHLYSLVVYYTPAHYCGTIVLCMYSIPVLSLSGTSVITDIMLNK